MSDERPRRLVAADIIGQQHEAVMAALNREASSASSTSEFGEAATGDRKGLLYVRSHVVVRGKDEDWPQYLGRMRAELGGIAAMVAAHNADKLRRDLEASVG